LTKIGLLSDTHHYLDPAIFTHFEQCDEIWHAGDFGTIAIADKIQQHFTSKIIRGVYGNIDGADIRTRFPEQLNFSCEEVKVMMRHIGGSPPNYNPETKKELALHQPQMFICGHSHILKVMYDNKINCLYMNPGAAGHQGWHSIRTAIRFIIDGKDIKNCEVIELGKRGSLKL
jgi:uncharacterized protein